MWSFEKLTEWIDTSLRSCMSADGALLVEFVLIGIAILVGYALLALFLIYAERKICAFFQCRLGPNRVGKWGIFQSVADMIPFAKGLQAIDFNVGVFYILAISSLGVVGILLAGWSSNSKYSMIGAMRSGAQLISYEISAGLSLMVIVVYSGTMQLSEIVAQQADGWFIFKGHVPAFIAFVTYLIAGHAETNRGPFDMAEAESELTAGYHTEYSGIQFGFFYLAEYLNLFIIAAVASTMFLGGWQPLHIPGWDGFNQVMDYIPSFLWFFVKTCFCMFMAMWVRWSFPRLRIDQLLGLEWKILMPICLINLILMSVVVIL